MTDQEFLTAAHFSLLPYKTDTLPSEFVLRELEGEPVVVGGCTVWFDEESESFAADGTKSCKEEGLVYDLFETYDELAAALAEVLTK